MAEEGSRRCLRLWGLIPILEGHCTLISSLIGVGNGVMINVPDPATITDSCASEVNGIISEQGMKVMTQVMSRRRLNPEPRAR